MQRYKGNKRHKKENDIVISNRKNPKFSIACMELFGKTDKISLDP